MWKVVSCAFISLYLSIFVALLYAQTMNRQFSEERYIRMRKEMVESQIKARGISDPVVLQAMEKVPRHKFVPENMREMAYMDGPLPIGEEQTISQPYIVALMTELLFLAKKDKVLEIGTGSGYQAAILAEIVEEVYSIEILELLYERAKETLTQEGYKNIKFKLGDGNFGWPEYAPFDKIMVTAAANEVPKELFAQLKEGGKMVLPLGDWFQELVLITKKNGKMKKKNIIPVRFVPLVKTKKFKDIAN